MEEKVSTIYEIRKIHGSDKFDVRIPNFGKIRINLFLKSIVYDSLISGDLELKGDFISINSGGIEYNSIKEIIIKLLNHMKIFLIERLIRVIKKRLI